MNTLYPIRFQPIYKYRLWGGNKLKTVLKKDIDSDNIGESWEISGVANDETIVSNGSLKGKTLKDLSVLYKTDFLGKSVYEKFNDEFPILIKFIDAATPLSIQVHPDNETAKKRHNSFGKNEMWYIMKSDNDAELIIGFEKELTNEAYVKQVSENNLLESLHKEKVSEGDVFYIPTGRVHAIGAGVMLAEIQQTSDITYRIYDYNRVDSKTGKTRELHNDLAQDVIDFTVHSNYKTDYVNNENVTNKLVHSPYFTTNILKVEDAFDKDLSQIDSFVIYMCVEGAITLEYKEDYILNTGETLLLPACIDEVKFKGKGKLIEVYI